MKLNICFIPTSNEALCLTKTEPKGGQQAEETETWDIWKQLRPLLSKHWMNEEQYESVFNFDLDPMVSMFTHSKDTAEVFHIDPQLEHKVLKLAKTILEEIPLVSVFNLIKDSHSVTKVLKQVKKEKFVSLKPIERVKFRSNMNKINAFSMKVKANLIFISYKAMFYPILVDTKWVDLVYDEEVPVEVNTDIQKVEPQAVVVPEKDEVQDLVKEGSVPDRSRLILTSPLMQHLLTNKIVYPLKLSELSIEELDDLRMECKTWINAELAKSMTKYLGKNAPGHVKNMIDGWAASSFSESSCDLQQAAANKFGVPLTSYALKMFKYNRLRVDTNKSSPFLDIVYARTQEFLKKSGIEYVTLFRGVALPENNFKRISYFKKHVETNPLNSWSSCVGTAVDFGSDHGDTTFPYVLCCKVPAANIVSTPITGFGCLNELEYIVVGGTYEVLLDPMTCLFLTHIYPRINGYKYGFSQFNLSGIKKDKNWLNINKVKETPFQDQQAIISAIDELLEIYKSNVKISRTTKSPSDAQKKKLFEGLNTKNVLDCLTSELTDGYIVVANDKDKPLNIDEGDNADWCKQSWDLPPYKSPEFMKHLQHARQTLEQFKQLLVYKLAVTKGRIKNDRWVR